MSIWYKIGRWDSKIEPVEVVKHTDKTLTLGATKWSRERRTSRDGRLEQFFPTWAKAHAALLQGAERKLEHARQALQNAQDFYGNVKGMKQPETQEVKQP